MQLRSILSIQWKSFTRHPLFKQTIVLRLLIYGYVLSLFACLYFSGMFIGQWATLLFSSKTDALNLFLFSAIPLIILDFILKFLVKKRKFNPVAFRRFPESNKSILIYWVNKNTSGIFQQAINKKSGL